MSLVPTRVPGCLVTENRRLVPQVEVHGLPMVGYPLCPYAAVRSSSSAASFCLLACEDSLLRIRHAKVKQRD